MSNPRDFLDEDNDSSMPQLNPRDFLEESPESSESFGQAALYAIPRVAEDFSNNIYKGIQNLPNRWKQAKIEVPGFLNPLNFIRHPIERGGQSLAGLLELGQKINHLPSETAQYAANRLHLIPERWANMVPQAPNLDEDINTYLGKPKNPGDALSRGLARNADLVMGANALLKGIPHLTKRGATKKLNKASKLAQEREIGQMSINPEIIEDARQFLPDIMQHRNNLTGTHAGDYNSLFDLQSKVGKISQARLGKIRSLFAPESAIKGQAGLEARRNLLKEMHENLQSLGHHDISDLLKQGQEDYSRYMKFRKYPRMLAGAAVAHSVPKNALTDLIKNIFMHGG